MNKKQITPSEHEDFNVIYELIRNAKNHALKQVNSTLIMLYWKIGEHLSLKTNDAGWGKNIVENLAIYIKSQDHHLKGFSARNLWRMKRFYETYQEHTKLSALLTEISWTNHLHILSKTKSIEEKEFYLNLDAKRNYPERDFARLIDSSTYERTLLADQKLSAALTEFPIDTRHIFKDTYVFEFLSLPELYKERDLQKALLSNLKHFLLELGHDFSLIGEEFRLSVGLKDFRIDLLMHHRGLNCLVAIELKVTEFLPEYLGKMQFYLEALDRDIKKPHENPSIGILICKTKDDEIVEYSLSRHLSPTMIAEYETKLIDKHILQQKLHELIGEITEEENKIHFGDEK